MGMQAWLSCGRFPVVVWFGREGAELWIYRWRFERLTACMHNDEGYLSFKQVALHNDEGVKKRCGKTKVGRLFPFITMFFMRIIHVS